MWELVAGNPVEVVTLHRNDTSSYGHIPSCCRPKYEQPRQREA